MFGAFKQFAGGPKFTDGHGVRQVGVELPSVPRRPGAMSNSRRSVPTAMAVCSSCCRFATVINSTIP